MTATQDNGDQAVTECTCPLEPEYDGPGEPVRMPGKSHRRGCPVVQHIFDMQDDIGRRMAEEHACRGGILPTPGEREARRAQESVESLARRLDGLEAALTEVVRMVEAIADALIEDGWPLPSGRAETPGSSDGNGRNEVGS